MLVKLAWWGLGGGLTGLVLSGYSTPILSLFPPYFDIPDSTKAMVCPSITPQGGVWIPRKYSERPVLILQAERALVEIALFRDACGGEPWERAEDAWRGINESRQLLLDSLTPTEEIALEEQRRETCLKTHPQFIRLEVTPGDLMPLNPNSAKN
jgi:hypothetical protein